MFLWSDILLNLNSSRLATPSPGLLHVPASSTPPFMATVTKTDLNRILSSVEAKSNESRDLPRREHLKQISDARVAGWKDTLAATRKAKIEWKAEKMRLEEEKRRQQDADEASLREKTKT